MFRNRGDVRVELNVIPRGIEHLDRFLSYARSTLMKSLRECLAFRRVREEFVKNLEAVLDLTVVSHAVRIAHPEAFAVDDLQRVLGSRIVNQPRVSLVWNSLEKCLSLSLCVRHQDI